jgi:soluble lytic murein transglycosylase
MNPVMIFNLQTLEPTQLVSQRKSIRCTSRGAVLMSMLLSMVLMALNSTVHAQNNSDTMIVDAREAFRKKDQGRLVALRSAAIDGKHVLAMWPDYWDLSHRISDVQQSEVAAFSERWRTTYVEDRLRNDWLLELGKRRDWINFAAEFPRFRMNDDREVTCYALLTEHLAGKEVRDAALAAWLAQREPDDGCNLLAATLVDAKLFTAADAWRKARYAMDASRPRGARQAAALISITAASAVNELTENPLRYLTRNVSVSNRIGAELVTLALMRLASTDTDAAAGQLTDRWARVLPADLAGWAWGYVGKHAAMKLQPEAADYYQRAALAGVEVHRALVAQTTTAPAEIAVNPAANPTANPTDWPDEMLAWKARAALRADGGKARWQQVVQAINAMSNAEQRDSAWVYWKARALSALAPSSQDSESMQKMAREQLSTLAVQMNFYAALAAEHLGLPVFIPGKPAPLTALERATAARDPGLARALQLIAMGLRAEGVREWNFSLRNLTTDRELLAAAQLACDRQVWDRCISTSDRTRVEIDMAQRFPMPFRSDVVAQATAIGLDPAYVYGLIRQESRFIMDARSGVGASGLMQIMPATARWTAKKIGLPYTNEQITDRDINLRLGTNYLKLVLDDFGGSQALAAAAYNAGPNRSRKWRDGPLLETAAWAENVPFSETRDYVKKVLSNAVYYTAQLSNLTPSIKARLGRGVVAADSTSVLNKDLP